MSHPGDLQTTRVSVFFPAGGAICRVPLMSFQMPEPGEKHKGDCTSYPTVKRQENKTSACFHGLSDNFNITPGIKRCCRNAWVGYLSLWWEADGGSWNQDDIPSCCIWTYAVWRWRGTPRSALFVVFDSSWMYSISSCAATSTRRPD